MHRAPSWLLSGGVSQMAGLKTLGSADCKLWSLQSPPGSRAHWNTCSICCKAFAGCEPGTLRKFMRIRWCVLTDGTWDMILLMEGIPNNHLGSIKPCEYWDSLLYQLVIAGFLPTVLIVIAEGPSIRLPCQAVFSHAKLYGFVTSFWIESTSLRCT